MGMPVPRPPSGRRIGIDSPILRCCLSVWRCDCPRRGCFPPPTRGRGAVPAWRSSPHSPRLTAAIMRGLPLPVSPAGRWPPAARSHSGCRERLPRRPRHPRSSRLIPAIDPFRRRVPQRSVRRGCGLAWEIRSSRLPSDSTATGRWHRGFGWQIAIGFAAPTCSCQAWNCDCPDAGTTRLDASTR